MHGTGIAEATITVTLPLRRLVIHLTISFFIQSVVIIID
jgi:hypothetical protein